MLSLFRRSSRPALWLIGVLLAAAPALALEPDEVALVINARVPDSRAMAELYSQVRHIPPGRIIEVNVDPDSVISPAEEMPFDAYEPQVAVPIRNFLKQHELQDRVKCLVTFWGLPIRIGRRQVSPLERNEATNVRKELDDARAAIAQAITDLEHSAAQLDAGFKPPGGDDLPHLAERFDRSVGTIIHTLESLQNTDARDAAFSHLLPVVRQLMGSDRTTQLIARPPLALWSQHPPATQDVADAQTRLQEVEQKVAAAQTDSATADDREHARQMARDSLGLFGYAFVALNQERMINDELTESALDSELSLLWWHDYPKARWLPNPLEWRAQARRHDSAAPPQSPALMVTRLDGPSLDVVRNIILTSAKVEAQGLHGQVAIDARGKTGNDPYAKYDQQLRDLADLVSKKTSLKLTLDNQEALISPHSLSDIAVYCGWYSLRNFSSPGSFSPGAVGFHIASFECLSLRGAREHGWVRGLLSEGVVGTVGPVAEPYLESFPPADEFIPLLMTGKVTLAEAYWRTIPWTSWMQLCIGDPLYNPFRNNAPLAVSDLPGSLARAIDPAAPLPPATRPATAPGR